MLRVQNKKLTHLSLAVFMAVSGLSVLAYTQHAHAASLSKVMVRFDRLKIGTATTGTVCAQPNSTATEAKVKVTFPTGYTLGLAATFTVDTTTNTASWPATAIAWPGIGTASSVSSQDVTFPSSDLTAGTLYCFNWINSAAVQVTATPNVTNLGSVTTQTSTPTDIDTAQYNTPSVSDDSIVVNAVVPPAFSLALNASTDTISALSVTAVATSTSPRTATINTNAKNGWQVWAKDANSGLTSAVASKTIASTTPGTVSTLSFGSEGYNTGVFPTSGSPTVDPAFASGGVNYKGGGLDTTLRKMASGTGVASNTILTITNNVSIAGSTPAANDYTDTIYITGAGLF